MLNYATWRPIVQVAHQSTIEPVEGATPRPHESSVARGIRAVLRQGV